MDFIDNYEYEADCDKYINTYHYNNPSYYIPDKSEAARFLALLDSNASFFTFQTFDDSKNRKAP